MGFLVVESKLWRQWLLWFFLLFNPFARVLANVEVDALHALKTNLNDPNGVLQSWDPTLVNPCTWLYVTCNNNNSVTRVDLGNAQLSGSLVPQLGQLRNLQYLELFSNNIRGTIPSELGDLTNLVGLDLYLNDLSGAIPHSLGKLTKLRFLRLNNNSLSGSIPKSLANLAALQVLDLSSNNLSGEVPSTGAFLLFTPRSFANNPLLCGPRTTKPCPGAPPFSPPPPFAPPPLLSEVDALHALKTSLNDPNGVLQSWDPISVNPCTWFHVTCNSDNSVIRVDLGNAQLSGSLVPQLGQLRNLQYLELFSNNISGTIPSELGNLTNLVSLDLYLNDLSGLIPYSLGKLTKLRFLRLNNNSLSGSIPKSLANLAALQVLDLSSNNLSGEVPSTGAFLLFTPRSFANNPLLCGPRTTKPCPGAPPFSPPPPFAPPPLLSEVDALHALKTSLNDPNGVLQSWDPTLVNPCTWFHVACNSDNSVIRVDLGNAQLSGSLVPQLGQLRNLQYLELFSNNISGTIPSELGDLTNLVSLDLYLNNFSGVIPDSLGNLTKLRFLRLNNNSLSGSIPKSLTNLAALQVLDLSNNNLSGEVPSTGSFSKFTPRSFANNPLLCGPRTTKPCPGAPPFSPPPPFAPPPPVSQGEGEEDVTAVTP